MNDRATWGFGTWALRTVFSWRWLTLRNKGQGLAAIRNLVWNINNVFNKCSMNKYTRKSRKGRREEGRKEGRGKAGRVEGGRVIFLRTR